MGLLGPVGATPFATAAKDMTKQGILAVYGAVLLGGGAMAQVAPATDDVWDVNQGTILILSTELGSPDGLTHPYDMRDMFGGTFGTAAAEEGNILFADGTAEGSTHIIEWRTKKPVTVKSFRLFAYEDPGTEDHAFGAFVLKAKAAGSLSFDTVLFEYTPSHPYNYVDADTDFLCTGNVQPVEAQEFRAEFTTWNGASGASANGPRIVELDAFTDFIPVQPTLQVAHTDISWDSSPGLHYAVQYRDRVDDPVWQDLRPPIAGTGHRMTVTDYTPGTARYYQVIPLD